MNCSPLQNAVNAEAGPPSAGARAYPSNDGRLKTTRTGSTRSTSPVPWSTARHPSTGKTAVPSMHALFTAETACARPRKRVGMSSHQAAHRPVRANARTLSTMQSSGPFGRTDPRTNSPLGLRGTGPETRSGRAGTFPGPGTRGLSAGEAEGGRHVRAGLGEGGTR